MLEYKSTLSNGICCLTPNDEMSVVNVAENTTGFLCQGHSHVTEEKENNCKGGYIKIQQILFLLFECIVLFDKMLFLKYNII
jgi:hypothetical protein